MFTAYWTPQRWSENAYQPFLKAVDDQNKISRESFGMRLDFEKYFIECENAAYVVKDSKTFEVIDRLKINQDNGIDTEDRILKFKNWYKNIYD